MRKGGHMTADLLLCLIIDLLCLSRFQLVCLGQHNRPGYGRLIHQFHHLFICRANAAAAVYQEQHPLQALPANQKFAGQLGPGLDICFRRFGIAIARQVNQLEPVRQSKEKISCLVRPGVCEVLARVVRPVSALTREDLPTFDRPAKAISGRLIGGRAGRFWAAAMKSHCPANKSRPASIS